MLRSSMKIDRKTSQSTIKLELAKISSFACEHCILILLLDL